MKSILSILLSCILFTIPVFPYHHDISFRQPQENEPRLFTFTSVSIRSCGNSYVQGVAKNEFTFLPSIVQTSILLYSSHTYTTDFAEMVLEAQTTIDDLNIGELLTTKAFTNGEQKYWRAKAIACNVVYESDTFLFDAYGFIVP